MPVSTGFAESFLITSICSIFQRQINSHNVLAMVMIVDFSHMGPGQNVRCDNHKVCTDALMESAWPNSRRTD